MDEAYATRHRANVEELEAFLRDVGQGIRQHVNAYLIGGCNMALRGLKDATKDMDAIVETRTDRLELGHVMQQMGYEKFPTDPFALNTPKEYEGFRGDLYRKQRHVGLDVFEKIVMDKFQLTEGMKERALEVRDYGRLRLHLLGNEDMCLFKAITNRPDDDDDVMTLIAQGLDVKVMRRALREQPARGGLRWPDYVAERLREIASRMQVDIPWIDQLLDGTE